MVILGMYDRKLPDAFRESLKKPLGMLIAGSPRQTLPHVLEFIRKQNPPLIVTIGDECSKITAHIDCVRWVSVFDSKVERRPVDSSTLRADCTLKVVNQAGTLTADARRVLRAALRSSSNINVMVDGEEDLLTLAALLYAPNGTIVMYGQPGEGIVTVVADGKTRNLARRIIDRMEVVK